jgi:TolB-like protein
MRFATILGVLVALHQAALGGEAATKPADQPAVLVLPLESIATESEHDADAVTRAINRSVSVNLSRARDMRVIEGKEPAPDRDTALDLGRVNQAGLVVWGNVQYAAGRVRIDSEVLGVEKRETIGHFKLTGTLPELFELEDELAEKLRRHLAPAKKTDEQPAADAPPEVPASQPLRIAQHARDPDWKTPRPVVHDDVTWRYNYRDIPYWYTPGSLYSPYAYYGFGSYRTWRWGPYRPLYGWRMSDVYSYDGLPARNFRDGWNPMHRYSGPVPARWLRD